MTNSNWYECRKWEGKDMSHILELGDNYECSVSFLMSGWQLLSSSLAFSFGFAHRAPWYNNYIFVLILVFWCSLQLFITTSSHKISCLFRVNCDNDHVVPGVLQKELTPIQNPYNTTVIPDGFQISLV